MIKEKLIEFLISLDVYEDYYGSCIIDNIITNQLDKFDFSYFERKWISVKDKKKPEIGEIVVAWLSERKEPVCVRYEEDENGPIWTELVPVDIYSDREDLISKWIPLPNSQEDE